MRLSGHALLQAGIDAPRGKACRITANFYYPSFPRARGHANPGFFDVSQSAARPTEN